MAACILIYAGFDVSQGGASTKSDLMAAALLSPCVEDRNTTFLSGAATQLRTALFVSLFGAEVLFQVEGWCFAT